MNNWLNQCSSNGKSDNNLQNVTSKGIMISKMSLVFMFNSAGNNPLDPLMKTKSTSKYLLIFETPEETETV